MTESCPTTQPDWDFGAAFDIGICRGACSALRPKEGQTIEPKGSFPVAHALVAR